MTDLATPKDTPKPIAEDIIHATNFRSFFPARHGGVVVFYGGAEGAIFHPLRARRNLREEVAVPIEMEAR